MTPTDHPRTPAATVLALPLMALLQELVIMVQMSLALVASTLPQVTRLPQIMALPQEPVDMALAPAPVA